MAACEDGLGDSVDHLYAGLPAQPARSPIESTKYVALTSGLGIGETALDVPKTMLLMDWVKGLFGDAEQSKDVVRLIICGTLCTWTHVSSCVLTLQLFWACIHVSYLDCALGFLVPTTRSFP